jgi:chromosome segregation ATPase
MQLEQVQLQLFEESETNKVAVENLRKERDHQKQLKESLTFDRDQLLAHDESHIRLSEMEATLQKTIAERDDLKESLKSSSTASNLQAESLQFELEKKIDELTDVRSQLEQVQSQLIEESDANEAEMENLCNELELEKQRAVALASEIKELTAQLSSKQLEIVSTDADNLNLHTQIAELNRRIDELDAVKNAAESHAEDLMKLSASTPVTCNLEDEIIAITADRNEIKSHFDDLSEEFELTKQTLERVQVRTVTAISCILRPLRFTHGIIISSLADGEWQLGCKEQSFGAR